MRELTSRSQLLFIDVAIVERVFFQVEVWGVLERNMNIIIIIIVFIKKTLIEGGGKEKEKGKKERRERERKN